MKTKSNRLIGIVISVVALLFIPFIAMQFTDEVNWTLADFVIAGILLLVTGLICDFILRNVKKKENRTVLIIAIILILLLIWAELAVGVFGTPLAGS